MYMTSTLTCLYNNAGHNAVVILPTGEIWQASTAISGYDKVVVYPGLNRSCMSSSSSNVKRLLGCMELMQVMMRLWSTLTGLRVSSINSTGPQFASKSILAVSLP